MLIIHVTTFKVTKPTFTMAPQRKIGSIVNIFYNLC